MKNIFKLVRSFFKFKRDEKKDLVQTDLADEIESKGAEIVHRDTNTPGLLVESNAIINGSYKMSIFEMRIFNYLVSLIGKEDTELKEYHIDFKDIVRDCNIDKGNISRGSAEIVKTQTKILKSRVIELETDEEWAAYNLFDVAKIKKDKNGNYLPTVIFKISNELKPHLIELQSRFTKTELSNILLLQSTYAVRFYKWARCYLMQNNKVIFSKDVSELKKMLDIEKSYSKFLHFKSYVLETAKQEINRTTDIWFSYRPMKDPREKRRWKNVVFDVYTKTDEEQEIMQRLTKDEKEAKKAKNQKQLKFIRSEIERVTKEAFDEHRGQLKPPKHNEPKLTRGDIIGRLEDLGIQNGGKHYRDIGNYVKSENKKQYPTAKEWYQVFFKNLNPILTPDKNGVHRTSKGKIIENLPAYVIALIANRSITDGILENEKKKKKRNEAMKQQEERQKKAEEEEAKEKSEKETQRRKILSQFAKEKGEQFKDELQRKAITSSQFLKGKTKEEIMGVAMSKKIFDVQFYKLAEEEVMKTDTPLKKQILQLEKEKEAVETS